VLCFLVKPVLLIFLVFCVVFWVGSVLLFFLVFCVVFFGEASVAHLFSFQCCIVILCSVCHRPVLCAPSYVSVSELSILDFPIGFLFSL